jgi:hypothetical protein
VADNTTCGDAGTECTNQDLCVEGVCQDNGFQTAGTACGSSDDTLCDAPDECDGAGECVDKVDPAETVCREDAGECDVRDLCDGTSKDCVDVFEQPGTSCGDPSNTLCTDPDTCDAEGNCDPNNTPCAFVTDSGLCTFDVSEKGGLFDHILNPTADRQFKLLFTPDNQNWIAYKQNASNPGQFFYNLFVEGNSGAMTTVEITVPYPFVTQGAMPGHMYDGNRVRTNGCFFPLDPALLSFGPQITINDWINGVLIPDPLRGNLVCTPALCGPDIQPTATCTFEVSFEMPAGGKAYVNYHLDYGLKGPMVDANPCDGSEDRYDRGFLDSGFDSFDALVNTVDSTGPVAIKDCQDYEFSHDDGLNTFGDTVQNLNVFKKISGAFGLAFTSDNESGIAGVPVTLIRTVSGKDVVVQSGVTDQDGYYLLLYKHTGKKEMYKIVLGGGYNLTAQAMLKANGWTEVNFDVFTGTFTVSTGPGN